MSPIQGKGLWTLYTDIDQAVARAPQVDAKYILCKVSSRGRYSAARAQEALGKVAAGPGLVPVAWMYNYLENVEAEAACIQRALADGFAAMILDAEADINGKFDAARRLVERVTALGVDLSRVYLCSDPRLDAKIDEIPTPVLAQICRGGFIPMIYGEILPSDRANAAQRVMQAAYDQYARHQAEFNYADPLMPAVATYWDNQGHARMDYAEFKRWCDEVARREATFVTLYRAGVTSDGAWRAFGELTVGAAPTDTGGPKEVPKREPFPLLGLHDREGGEWLAQEGIRGWCLDTVEIGLAPRRLDYTALAAKGVRVLVRLNHGYGSTGTLPREDRYPAFADAVVRTIANSPGAHAFILGNEPNNPNEWPGGEQGGTPITPEQYGKIWNLVWFRVAKNTPLIPAPIDPYFGPGSDSRRYWVGMMQAILRGVGSRRGGADGLAFHPKLQWHDKALIRSDVTFTDAPLLGLPLHWRAWETLWEVTPAPFKTLPIYLTECNPQRKSPDGPLGWRDEDDGVIGEMIAFERQMNIKHSDLVKAVIFYRWPEHDSWGMINKPSLVAAIRAAAKDVATAYLEFPLPTGAPFLWPTEHRVVTQRFGINPQNYPGLPGHEGVDLKAPTGSDILAAYGGTIVRIDEMHRAYGYSIRQKVELDGHTYELVYAHGVRGSGQVNVGDEVQIGQVLMKADETGNARGPHLHFTMKEPGVTYVDKDANGNNRRWPFFILDPSPFLGIE